MPPRIAISPSGGLSSKRQAHLKALETRNDDQSRYRWKLVLVKRLYERHYSRQNVLELFRFIDWVMSLPEGLEIHLAPSPLPAGPIRVGIDATS